MTEADAKAEAEVKTIAKTSLNDVKSGGHSTADPTGTSARQQLALALRVSGDNSLRVPPVPIPNTEVKPQHADSTWLETAR